MSLVHIRGNNLYYYDQGEGEPLVLIHGTGFNADIWYRVYNTLVDEFRVIAYDRRGFGRSEGMPLGPRGYYHEQAEDAAQMLDLFGACPATILGWSAGAVVALQLALEHPECVKRLILYEPSLHLSDDLDAGFILPYMQYSLLRLFRRYKAAAHTFGRMILKVEGGRNSFDTLDPVVVECMEADAESLVAEVSAGTGRELTLETLASGIKVPVTLIVGEASPAPLKRSVARLAATFPAAEVARIPGTGHLAQVENPEEFLRIIRQAMSHPTLFS